MISRAAWRLSSVWGGIVSGQLAGRWMGGRSEVVFVVGSPRVSLIPPSAISGV